MEKHLAAENPVNKKVLGHIKATSEKELEKVYRKSEEAGKKWSRLSQKERTEKMESFRKVLAENRDKICETVRLDTGKSKADAMVSEVLPTLTIMDYNERKVGEVVKTEKKSTPLEFYKNKSYVEYTPFGTVAVISPWNYPFHLSVTPCATALITGNTVVLKISEKTPLTGELLKNLVEESDLPENVLQIVQGDGSIGQRMVELSPDKVFFTGSTDTGKKVMETASRNLVPVHLELGDKTPFIVLPDADLDKAAEACVYSALTNTGQLCVSTEKVLVHERVYEEFVKKLVEETEKVELNQENGIGPMVDKEQKEKVLNQLKSSLEKGGELLTEIKGDGNFLSPQIVLDVGEDTELFKEETFGPVIPVKKFSSVKNCIKLVNSSKYGLNSYIFTENVEKGREIASKLEVGNCYINGVVKNIANPELPFGGVKKSGIGRYHGKEGLKEFVQSKSVMVNHNSKGEINRFSNLNSKAEAVSNYIEGVHVKEKFFDKVKGLLDLKKEMD